MRTVPKEAGHTPSKALTSEDLPEPLGPTIPSADPASRLKLMPCTTVFFEPGGTTAMFSTDKLADGFGS